ncbi:protein kinase [Planctomycetota bacterium]
MSGQNKNEKKVFMAALKLKSAPEREAYLQEACGDDQRMLERVRALLRANEIKDDFLEAPAYDADVTLDTAPMTEGPGTIVGPYKLLEKIGEGGMAVVYMAEQREPIHRQVALKVIKLGMDTKQVIARFEAERQALAMMNHPNIAKVLDAGTTETGRPYFVMELVRGVSIGTYCDTNKLNTQQRLDLFMQVCHAVQHAHQKGIIHRDIKPSNVMVTLHDDIAVPMVIDFGIAKATSQRLTEKTLFTRYAQMVGTPEYMSPEQAQFSGLDIDTRSDIYSLGVLLYELLTGTTPFDAKTLREAGYGEIQRIIQETEPPKPSTKLSTMGKTLTSVAEQRDSSPDLLARVIRGDLDWIVMKALEKNRTRRYETVNALAADIRRHINDEPVEAGPPSALYRAGKFLRRHQNQAITTAVAAVVLGVVTVVLGMYFEAVNRAKEAEFFEHKDILSKTMELRSQGQLQDALAKVETIAGSEYVGAEAKLLHAQLILKLAESTSQASPAHAHSEALVELESLLTERDEIAGQAHFHLARIYYDTDPNTPGSTEERVSKWEHHRQEAERLLPKTADACLLRALSTSTVPLAIDYLNKAIEIDARHYDSLRERAYLSYAEGDYYKMAKDAARMVGIQPENPLGYSLSAIAQRELGQSDEAVKDHDRAIGLSADDVGLYDERRSPGK